MVALLDLPVELLLQIISYLPDKADNQCLRITCRAFRNLISPADKRAYDHDPFYDQGAVEKQDFELLKRLLLPGNVFSQLDALVCGMCVTVKHKNKFPLSNLRIDGKDVCEHCVKLLLVRTLQTGHNLTYDSDHYNVCTCCEDTVHQDQTAKCGKRNEPFDLRCIECHRGFCEDPDCEGWQSDYEWFQSCAHRFYVGEYGYDDYTDYHPDCPCTECEKERSLRNDAEESRRMRMITSGWLHREEMRIFRDGY